MSQGASQMDLDDFVDYPRIAARYPLDDIINVSAVHITDDDMDFLRVKKILQRFTKAQLLNEVLSIGGLSEQFPHGQKVTKLLAMDYITQIAKNTVTDLNKWCDLCQLKRCQLYPKTREWRCFVLKHLKSAITSDPERFASLLQDAISKTTLLTSRVTSVLYNGKLWTAVSVKFHTAFDSFFFVTLPPLPVIIHTSIKVKFQTPICRAFLVAFDSLEFQEFHMKTRQMDTLLQFCIKELSINVQNSDLDLEERERQFSDDAMEAEGLPPNLFLGYEHEVAERMRYIQQTFRQKQPMMESLGFAVGTNFFSFADQRLKRPSMCRTIFKGENVLEGIYKLVKNGNAVPPVPDYLLNVRNGNRVAFRLEAP